MNVTVLEVLRRLCCMNNLIETAVRNNWKCASEIEHSIRGWYLYDRYSLCQNTSLLFRSLTCSEVSRLHLQVHLTYYWRWKSYRGRPNEGLVWTTTCWCKTFKIFFLLPHRRAWWSYKYANEIISYIHELLCSSRWRAPKTCLRMSIWCLGPAKRFHGSSSSALDWPSATCCVVVDCVRRWGGGGGGC